VAAVEKIIHNLYNGHIAVKVEAALAITELLEHQIVQDVIRPGLGDVLKVFLKIMDEIDFEDLVAALRKIVDYFEDDIAPFAVSLCQKLSAAYIRCIESKG
jgi:importin-7